MKAKWLFDEHPILIDKKLAAVIGFNEAVVLQQLNYWLHSNSAKKIDGRLWVYNSYENWRKDNFPFWSTRTIRRIFDSCEKKGIILTGNFNKAGFDKTKWYSIDENKLNDLMDSPCGQNVQTIRTNSPYPSGHSVQANTIYYPETTSKTTTNNQAQPDALAQQRREIIEYLNKKTDSKFKPNAKGNKSVIDPRLKEGYTVDDMKMIIDAMYSKWHGNKFSNGSMGDDYLRPETLFRVSKIEGYLNIARKMKKQQKPDDMFDMGGWIRE